MTAARSKASGLVIDSPLKSNKGRGTRVVYQGLYNGRPAVIKVYSHPMRRRLHWFLCHFNGKALRKRGIPAPAVRYSGYAASLEAYVIVYEKLEAPRDFRWIKTEPDRARRLDGYRRLIPLFAMMHANGIAQKDTTPGNFLESSGKVHAIDEDRMDIRPWPLGKGASLGNLASVFTQFPPEGSQDMDALFNSYMNARNWKPDARWRRYLDRRIRRFRAWRKDKRGYERKRNLLIAAAAVAAGLAIWLAL